MHMPVVGSVARALQSVPVVRAQDEKIKGVGAAGFASEVRRVAVHRVPRLRALASGCEWDPPGCAVHGQTLAVPRLPSSRVPRAVPPTGRPAGRSCDRVRNSVYDATRGWVQDSAESPKRRGRVRHTRVLFVPLSARSPLAARRVVRSGGEMVVVEVVSDTQARCKAPEEDEFAPVVPGGESFLVYPKLAQGDVCVPRSCARRVAGVIGASPPLTVAGACCCFFQVSESVRQAGLGGLHWHLSGRRVPRPHDAAAAQSRRRHHGARCRGKGRARPPRPAGGPELL